MINEIILKPNELLEIRGDRIFHDMFNEYEMDTIEWLVMKILNCKYEDIHGRVKVGGTESPNLSKDDKGKRLDLVVYYNNKVIDIELNNNSGLEYSRNAHYISNRVINSNLIGENYDKQTQGILVNLNWYKLKSDIDNIDTVVETEWEYPTLEKEKPDYFVKFINVNLFKIQQICYNEINEREFVWKLFTINKKEELNDLVKNEKMLNNYQKKIERLSKDKEYCRMIWDERIDETLRRHDDYFNGKYEGISIGRNEGYASGKTDGIKQKQTEMIINMYEKNIDIKTISEVSNLSIDEIEKIIESNKKII